MYNMNKHWLMHWVCGIDGISSINSTHYLGSFHFDGFDLWLSGAWMEDASFELGLFMRFYTWEAMRYMPYSVICKPEPELSIKSWLAYLAWSSTLSILLTDLRCTQDKTRTDPSDIRRHHAFTREQIPISLIITQAADGNMGVYRFAYSCCLWRL